jgi:hypothetical protein
MGATEQGLQTPTKPRGMASSAQQRREGRVVGLAGLIAGRLTGVGQQRVGNFDVLEVSFAVRAHCGPAHSLAQEIGRGSFAVVYRGSKVVRPSETGSSHVDRASLDAAVDVGGHQGGDAAEDDGQAAGEPRERDQAAQRHQAPQHRPLDRVPQDGRPHLPHHGLLLGGRPLAVHQEARRGHRAQGEHVPPGPHAVPASQGRRLEPGRRAVLPGSTM